MANGTSIPAQMRLYNEQRQRLYINRSERQRLLELAPKLEPQRQALLLTLLYTGCRASETLELTSQDVQFEEEVLSIRTLKKRRFAMREIPIPPILCNLLDQTFRQQGWGDAQPFWSISRKTVWRHITKIMAQADITGVQACPKGLRHGFGIHAIHCGIDLATVQKWMGHSKLSVTAIYTNATPQDERARARVMW